MKKQEAAIRDQHCGSEDRFSQEEGDDAHHPAIYIHLPSHEEEEETMDLRTNPFQKGGDDGRGPSINPLRGHQNATLRQPLES